MVTLFPLTHEPIREPIMRKRVLVVEDEQEIRQLIVLHLKREGYEVEEAGDGELARYNLSKGNYDLVVLDWMLPSLNGLELTRWLRRQDVKNAPLILFVTAKADAEHVATGLDAGADDYLTKPFDTLVLMARVNALLRRRDWLKNRVESPTEPSGQVIILGELELNPSTYEVTLSKQPLELTRSEFRLLETLMANQGKVLSRESLIEQIQGENVNVVGRTVDTHVFGLRKKLGPYADMIETIRGVGYRVRYLPA
ncbi:MAG: response regulator transcription factor [Bdellovibrionales bacterium]